MSGTSFMKARWTEMLDTLAETYIGILRLEISVLCCIEMIHTMLKFQEYIDVIWLEKR